MIDADLLGLAARLLRPEERAAAADALAARLGADTLLIFVRDPDVDTLLPAAGFPQTLPDGRSWRTFLAACTEAGAHAGALRLAGAAQPVPAWGVASAGEAVLVLLGTPGGAGPSPEACTELGLLLPFVAAAVRGEQIAGAADAQARMARDAAAQATALARTLDTARGALQEALRDASVAQVAQAVTNEQLQMANEQLHDQAGELEAANEQLQDLAAELEAQHEELQSTVLALTEREARYRALVQATATIVWTASADGRFVAEQAEWAAYTGQSFEGYREWGWIDALHPEDRERTETAWREAVATGSVCAVEYRLRRYDGVYRTFSVRAVPVFDGPGMLREWVGGETDITDQRAAEETLHERERLAAFTADVGTALTQSDTLPEMLHRCCEAMVERLEAAFARVWTLDAATQVLELKASAGLYTHLDGAHSRVPVGQLKIGRIALERRPHLTNDVLHDDRISDSAWARREGMVAFAGFPLVMGDRVAGVMALFARRALTEATLDAMAAVAHGMALGIERRQAEEALQTSEVRYRSLVTATTDVVWVCEADGRLTNEQPSWAEYTGERFDRYRDFGWTDAIHPEDRDALLASWRAAAAARHFPETQGRLRRRDGAYRLFGIRAVPIQDATGTLLEWVGAATDITDRVRAEGQLRQAQRLQAVGTLAGGMAHEVNNQMTAVLGFGEFALRALGSDHPQAKDVGHMVRAAERAATITRQLLAFSRRQIWQPRVVDLPALIAELQPVLEHLLGADKTLAVLPGSSPGLAVADPTQIEQVLINLTANARDAMPSGGRLTIGLDEAALDESFAAAHGGVHLVPGPYVLLFVSDTGAGMDRPTLEQIFEPFFTTKPVGQGTGLGLSMVYGIVKQHGGFVWAYSEPGVGTTMSVYLPAAPPLAATPADGAALAQGRPTAQAGATILLVEDEPAVRVIARRALEWAGYSVVDAQNGRDAMERISGLGVVPDLVVTDVVMPELNGRELNEALARTHPDLPVLYMSGHAGNDILLRGLIPDGAPFLQKPFPPEALVERVAQLLRRRAPNGMSAAAERRQYPRR